MGSRRVGVRLAAALVATCSLHQVLALQARPHAAHTTLAWLALWALVRLVERPDAVRAATAAAALLLGVGSFQTGLFLLPPTLLATALLLRKRDAGSVWAWPAPVAALLACALLLPGAGVSEQGLELTPGGHSLRWAWFDGTGWRGALRSLGDFDPVLFVGSAIGAVLAVRARPSARRDATALLCAYVLPYGVVLALDVRTTDRYLLPLVPLFALLTAHALARALGRAAHARFAGASALLLAVPLLVCAKSAALGLRPDTLEQAARWLDGQVAAGEREVVTTPGLYLPRVGQREALAGPLATGLRLQSPWLAYQERRAASLPRTTLDLRFFPHALLAAPRGASQPIANWLAELPATWIAIEVSRYTYDLAALPGVGTLRETLAAHGPPVAVFAGESDAWTFAMPCETASTPARSWRVLRASAFGPRIEIYRWTPD